MRLVKDLRSSPAALGSSRPTLPTTGRRPAAASSLLHPPRVGRGLKSTLLAEWRQGSPANLNDCTFGFATARCAGKPLVLGVSEH